MQDVTEQELRDSGFSERQITILKKNLERENLTIHFQLTELKNRLFRMCGLLTFVSVIWIYVFFTSDEDSFIAYCIAMIIFFFLVYFMTPLPFAIRAYHFLKKNNNRT